MMDNLGHLSFLFFFKYTHIQKQKKNEIMKVRINRSELETCGQSIPLLDIKRVEMKWENIELQYKDNNYFY
jgi:hypothetical protein